jgi:hypothetical protein
VFGISVIPGRAWSAPIRSVAAVSRLTRRHGHDLGAGRADGADHGVDVAELAGSQEQP